jgi:serine phosphatase RsbU (regulator of sigma subunit)
VTILLLDHLKQFTWAKNPQSESFNDSGEQFGERRLIEALQRHRTLAPQDLIGSVLAGVRSFNPREQPDDITLIIGQVR